MNDQPTRVTPAPAVTAPVSALSPRRHRRTAPQVTAEPTPAPAAAPTQEPARPAPAEHEPSTATAAWGDTPADLDRVPQPEPLDRTAPSAATSAPKPRKKRGSGQPTSKEPTAVTLTSLHLPRDLFESLKAREARDQLTHGTAIVLAYQHAADVLDTLVADDQTTDITIDPDFPLDLPPTTTHRPAADTIQMGARMTHRSIAGLDTFVARSGARSRSHLTTLVLRHWLSTTS